MNAIDEMNQRTEYAGYNAASDEDYSIRAEQNLP